MWKKGSCHVGHVGEYTLTRRESFNEQVRRANGQGTTALPPRSLFPSNDCPLFIERAHTIPRPCPEGTNPSGWALTRLPAGGFVCFAGPGEFEHCVVSETRVDLVPITSQSHTGKRNGTVGDSLSVTSPRCARRRDKISRRITPVYIDTHLVVSVIRSIDGLGNVSLTWRKFSPLCANNVLYCVYVCHVTL